MTPTDTPAERLRQASIFELAVMMHEAEDGDDDLTLMAIDSEVYRRDSLVPPIKLPVTGNKFAPTPNREQFNACWHRALQQRYINRNGAALDAAKEQSK